MIPFIHWATDHTTNITLLMFCSRLFFVYHFRKIPHAAVSSVAAVYVYIFDAIKELNAQLGALTKKESAADICIDHKHKDFRRKSLTFDYSM